MALPLFISNTINLLMHSNITDNMSRKKNNLLKDILDIIFLKAIPLLGVKSGSRLIQYKN